MPSCHKHLAASALLGLALFSATQAHAAGVSLASDFTDYTSWTLFGSASASNQTPGNGFTYSNLMLTPPGSNDRSGAGFAPAALNLDFNAPFFFDFNFFIAGNGLRGDGLTFTLTSAPGLAGGDGGGSSLGYQGLEHSVALAIDTFNFDGEPVSPSLQILQNGDTAPLAFTETGVGDIIRNVPYQSYASLSYAPSGNGDSTGTLTGMLTVYTTPDDPSQLLSFSVAADVDMSSLGSEIFYGFTAATGASSDGHFITSAMPVPEPGTWALMCAGLYVCARRLRRPAA